MTAGWRRDDGFFAGVREQFAAYFAGAGGLLTGYAGGLELKQWLIDHEAPTARCSAGGVTPVALVAVSSRAVQLKLG